MSVKLLNVFNLFFVHSIKNCARHRQKCLWPCAKIISKLRWRWCWSTMRVCTTLWNWSCRSTTGNTTRNCWQYTKWRWKNTKGKWRSTARRRWSPSAKCTKTRMNWPGRREGIMYWNNVYNPVYNLVLEPC